MVAIRKRELNMDIIEWKDNEYEIDMPSETDESYAGGMWDLAGDFMDRYKDSNIDTFQTELYGLLGVVTHRYEKEEQ